MWYTRKKHQAGRKKPDWLHLLLQMFFSFSICLIKSSTPNPSSATLSLLAVCWLVDGKGYYSRIFFNSDHHINGFSLSLTSNRNLFLWISSASFLNGSCFVDKTLNVWGTFHWSSNPMPSYMLFVPSCLWCCYYGCVCLFVCRPCFVLYGRKVCWERAYITQRQWSYSWFKTFPRVPTSS